MPVSGQRSWFTGSECASAQEPFVHPTRFPSSARSLRACAMTLRSKGPFVTCAEIGAYVVRSTRPSGAAVHVQVEQLPSPSPSRKLSAHVATIVPAQLPSGEASALAP
eukprot:6170837-Prymnesium_polylepis.2